MCRNRRKKYGAFKEKEIYLQEDVFGGGDILKVFRV